MVDEIDNKAAGTHTVAEGGAEDPQGDSASHSERDRWLDTMADLASTEQRHYASVSRRLDKLETRAGGVFSSMDEDMKLIMLLAIAAILAPVVIDLVGEVYRGWRQRFSS